MKTKNKELIFFAADFEKAFDSIDHNFISATLQRFGFGEGFTKWIKILLSNNQSCVINNGRVTDFFKVQRGTKQGDPISPYIFILIIEIMAIMIRSCTDIQGLNLEGIHKKFVLFADDTTLFLNDKVSLDNVLRLLNLFHEFSSLKINYKKSEIGVFGCDSTVVLNDIKDMKRIDFYDKGIRILGIFHSLNRTLHYKNNFQRVLTNFNTTLTIWSSRNLTLYGKIQILKSLALPKLLYICNNLHVDDEFIKLVESSIKDFIWNGRKPKIKTTTLIGDYASGGLKLPHFESYIKANRIKWAIKLLSSDRKTWNIIPRSYLRQMGGFEHINLNFDVGRIPSYLPLFYSNILTSWANITHKELTNDLSTVWEQYLWNNRYIKINNNAIFIKEFATKQINFIIDLCDSDGNITWDHAKSFGLRDEDSFKWFQLVHSIPKDWKNKLKEDKHRKQEVISRTLELKNKKIILEKIKMKDIYSHLIDRVFTPPSAQENLGKKLGQEVIWEKVYERIYTTTIDSYMRYFQFRIVNNVLYLNRDLYRFRIIDSPSCSYCWYHLETVEHLFIECVNSKNLYCEIQNWLKKYNVKIPNITKTDVILGVDDTEVNLILLMYKLALYKAREKGITPSLSLFKNSLMYLEKIENKIAKTKNRMITHEKKWKNINNALN